MKNTWLTGESLPTTIMRDKLKVKQSEVADNVVGNVWFDIAEPISRSVLTQIITTIKRLGGE